MYSALCPLLPGSYTGDVVGSAVQVDGGRQAVPLGGEGYRERDLGDAPSRHRAHGERDGPAACCVHRAQRRGEGCVDGVRASDRMPEAEDSSIVEWGRFQGFPTCLGLVRRWRPIVRG